MDESWIWVEKNTIRPYREIFNLIYVEKHHFPKRKDHFRRNGERESQLSNNKNPLHLSRKGSHLNRTSTDQNMVHDDPKEANRRKNGKISKSNFFWYFLCFGNCHF